MIPTLMAIAFLVSVLLTWHFSRPETVFCILDEPNARSLHTRPIPVSGGIAICIGFTIAATLACWYIVPTQSFFLICLSGLLVAIISFIDDCHHVSILYRLIIHFFVAYLLLWQGEFRLTYLVLPGMLWELPLFLQISVSFLFIVWMINLYNFMDGMDGFAGGMTVFGFTTLAILGGLANHQLFMVINLIVACAAGGFLVFNFPPARIFMGDTGASSLGFLAAAFSLWGNHERIFPLWIALLAFSPFIVDATVTLLRRLVRGEKIWLAHKSHYYQQLVQLGWGHKRTVLWEYVLMAACSISALFILYLPIYAQWILLIGWIFVYMLLIYLVNQLTDVTH
ncbi:glycosyltransferase family 4 protein [Candidatus Parabeggiatoa sp. HSG14]|uniref:MraY family glycosyltransferase n=1 Tax=Candidatus Parabeggiatoa sp. HSG14 TaxID=3055593 RepID=UPI0025A921DE|nr:glycosyltransferase family 4 protein [Thiotrichales bacterium HSG14]